MNEGFASPESGFWLFGQQSVRGWLLLLVAFVRSEREVLTTAFILPTSVRAIIIFGRAASITLGAYFIMDGRKRKAAFRPRTQKVPPPESFVAKQVAPPKRPTCDAPLPARNQLFDVRATFFVAP